MKRTLKIIGIAISLGIIVYGIIWCISVAIIMIWLLSVVCLFFIPNDNDVDDSLLWEYGTCRDVLARRHRIKRNVQMKLWRKGDKNDVDGIGHKNDVWHNFHKDWWADFKKK